MTDEKFKNILAFCFLMVWDDESIFNKHPDYIKEKYMRYCENDRVEYAWGLHPTLKRHMERYFEKWGLNDRCSRHLVLDDTYCIKCGKSVEEVENDEDKQ